MSRVGREFPSFEVWNELKICDWCGRDTHGKTYYDEPSVVYCTSCHNPLVGTPDSGKDEDDDSKYYAPV